MIENLKELPKPIGNYTVGISHKDFTYQRQNEQRHISVMIYYPADSSEGKESYPYVFPEAVGNTKLSNSILKTKTHCYQEISISDSKINYPVLIYNHGYGCFEMINTVLCSDLVSCGYIVVSVGHPEEASAIRYPGGEIVKMNPSYSEEITQEVIKELESMLEEIEKVDENEDDVLIKLGREFYEFQNCYNSRMNVWVMDTIKAVDFIERLNNGEDNTMFTEKLRLDNGIGITGHSYGGSTAVQACHDDERFVCGINIDGGDFGDYYGIDIGKPFFTIGNPHLWRLNRGYFVNNCQDAYHLTVKNADHMGFTDYLFIGRDNDGQDRLGDREPYNFRELMINYHLKFFERYLLNKSLEFKNLKYEDTDFHKKLVCENKNNEVSFI